MKRIAFIDGSNLFWAIREVSRQKNDLEYRLDYTQLKTLLFHNTDEVARVYYYGALPDDASDAQLKYIQKLRYLGFKIRLFPLKKYPDNTNAREKGVDVSIAMDMLELAYNNAYDTAVLVSHDEDFCELVERVQRIGKSVDVCGFVDRMSQRLIEAADRVINLVPVWDVLKWKGS